jgi:hypothetical protein
MSYCHPRNNTPNTENTFGSTRRQYNFNYTQQNSQGSYGAHSTNHGKRASRVESWNRPSYQGGYNAQQTAANCGYNAAVFSSDFGQNHDGRTHRAN